MVSDAQKRASKKWVEANKERKAYIVKRSTCRSFLKKLATIEDLNEMEEIIKERKKNK
ncbi:hypothetical protein [Ligilactobacillus ceti]|uniref:Uncharacterized protein n=1 Tax=Ligilactobacillus ceti DSM 22408 TaxID=1122146 RepID=A0A0R2KGS2_9LACO|nr:hypothetical protein [Ligilactobacillus ceti]KRN88595.1 hypothetical protein IV53_GL000560 [Ligilactobacillus ceti DSM 22408]